MIATCPACGKRYRLADEAVPAGGRPVRCAACGAAWTALPGAAAGSGPDAAFVPPGQPELPIAPAPAARMAPVAADGPTASPLAATRLRPPPMDDPPPRRRRHIGWIAAVVALLAVGALAVIEFAPEDTFDPPRLGLPPPHLALADVGSLAPPSLPAIDLTRIPVIGDRLDAWVHPAASPLRIAAHGERHRLANGTWLLTVGGSVANPTGAPVVLSGIDASLADAGGRPVIKWRIAAPVTTIGAHSSATFESTAANFPDSATVLRLTPR